MAASGQRNCAGGNIRAGSREQATNDIITGYTPLAFSTDKLNSDCQNLLATLGTRQEPTEEQRRIFLISYFTDVNDEVN